MYGEVSFTVRAAAGAPVVDRVVVSIRCHLPPARFYSVDLRWNGRLGAWTGGHEEVLEGSYSLMVDAAVDDLVFWRAYESELEVASGQIALFEFSIQDRLRSEAAPLYR